MSALSASNFSAIRSQPIKKEFQGTPVGKGAELMGDPQNPSHLFMNLMARDFNNSGNMTVTKTSDSVSSTGGYQSASNRRASFQSRRKARLLGTGTNLES